MNNNKKLPNDSFNMMNLFNKDPLALLKYLYSQDQNLLVEQINKIDNNKTFFSELFFNKRFELGSASIETIQFLIDCGFDFRKNIRFTPNVIDELYAYRTRTYNPEKQNEDIFCDYLLFFKKFKHEQLNYITEKIIETDVEFIKNLPQNGYHILHYAMASNNLKLVERLFQIGLSPYDKDLSNKTVRDYAIANVENLNSYDSLIEKYFSEKIDDKQREINFQNALEWLRNAAKNVYKSTYSSNYESNVNQFLDYLKFNLSKYPEAQQEQMIATCLYSSDYSLLNKTLKLINKTSKNYEPKHYPLWKNLGEAESHQYIYYFLENKNLSLATYHTEQNCANKINLPNKDFFLLQLAKFLNAKGYNSFSMFSTGQIKVDRGSEGAKQKKIYSLLHDKINIDFLLSKDAVTDETWFTNICNSSELFKAFGNYLKYISTNSPTKEYAEEKNNYNEYFQKLLSNTWFDKNKSGKYNIESALSNQYYYIDNDFYFTKQEHFVADSKKPLYTTEQKVYIFSKLVRDELISSYDWTSYNDNGKKFFIMLDNLINDESVNWINLDIQDSSGKSLLNYDSDKKRDTKNSFIDKINKVKSYHSLSQNSQEKKEKTYKTKI